MDERELINKGSWAFPRIECDTPDCGEVMIVERHLDHANARIFLKDAGWTSLGDFDYCHKCSITGWKTIEEAIRVYSNKAVNDAMEGVRHQLQGVKLAVGHLACRTHVSDEALRKIEEHLEAAEVLVGSLDG